MIKKRYNVLILVLLANIGLGQTIFDIDIDEIYLDDDNIALINKGEVNTYSCELTPIIKRDFQHEIILQCDEDNDWMWSDNPRKIELSQLIEFKSTRQLIDYVKDYKFAEESNASNQKHLAFLQYFDDHLFANINFRNYKVDNPNWKFYDVDFWNYVFIRINGKYLVIALVSAEDPSPAGFIIPTKKEVIVVFKDFIYTTDGERIDSIDLSSRVGLKDFYRISKQENSLIVSDRLFSEVILSGNFDKIDLMRDYIRCVSDGDIQLFDKAFNQVNIKDLNATYDCFGSIQAIIGDQMKWIDYKWNIHDTFPDPNWGICGTMRSTQREIKKTNNSFYESYTTGYSRQKHSRDSILLVVDNTAETVSYLNNQNQDNYDEYSDLGAVFRFPYNYYMVKRKHQDALIEIINNRDSVERILTLKVEYSHNSQAKNDSIINIINGLQDEIEIKELFTGQLEAFSYNHPIKFESDGLFGYYPQNEDAKYRRLDMFNFYFAEFIDKEGKEGWLDIYGNEYYKKK